MGKEGLDFSVFYFSLFPGTSWGSSPCWWVNGTDARIAYTDNKTVALVGIAETLVLRWVSLPN